MKLYVAGPMTGIEHNNFPAFEEAATRLRGCGYDVLAAHEVALPCGCRSSLNPCGPAGHEYETFLRNDLMALLGHAEGIALLPGWEGSNGAKLEVEVGGRLAIPAHSVRYWSIVRAARPVSA